MSASTIKWLAITGFILICIFCIFFHAESIEQDLTAKSKSVLLKAGYHQPAIAFDGQDATISGETGSREIKEQIGNMIAGVEGVRVVKNYLTVPEKPNDTEPAKELTNKETVPATKLQDPNSLIKLQQKLSESILGFETNSYNVDVVNQKTLKNLAFLLNKYPDTKIEIAGFADASGNPAHNLALSLKRANAVKNFLIKEGVDPKRLTTAAYGDNNPLAHNATPQARQKNRRVEFKIKESN